MKLLKIENNKGFFQLGDENWIEIDQITKENLMVLLDKFISEESTMDKFEADNIQNKAHQIIYSNLYRKFSDLQENKSRFKVESEKLYKEALDKYSIQ